MRRCLIALGLFAALPANATEDALTCQFQTACNGEDPCAPIEQDGTFGVRRDGTSVTVTMDDDPILLHQTAGAEGNPATFFGAEPGDGGGMMLSLFDDGTAIVTIHGDLFGPFIATAFGTCGVPK